MYAARHASIQLGDESLAKLKSELNTYYIDYEQVEIGESLGEGVCWSTVCIIIVCGMLSVLPKHSVWDWLMLPYMCPKAFQQCS